MGFAQRILKSRGDLCEKPAECKIQDNATLDFLANPHTSSAQNAFLRLIANEGVILPRTEFPPCVIRPQKAVSLEPKFISVALECT